MIVGVIENSVHPYLKLNVVANGNQEELKFLVDTGFDGEIALSYEMADHFDLEPLQSLQITYASGESREELVAEGKIVWFGQERQVVVLLSNDEKPAIGTQLLRECLMIMDFPMGLLTLENKAKDATF